jgi:hypothetical protein
MKIERIGVDRLTVGALLARHRGRARRSVLSVALMMLAMLDRRDVGALGRATGGAGLGASLSNIDLLDDGDIGRQNQVRWSLHGFALLGFDRGDLDGADLGLRAGVAGWRRRRGLSNCWLLCRRGRGGRWNISPRVPGRVAGSGEDRLGRWLGLGAVEQRRDLLLGNPLRQGTNRLLWNSRLPGRHRWLALG